MFYSTNIFNTATTSGKFIPSGQPRIDRGSPRLTAVQNLEPPVRWVLKSTVFYRLL